MSMKKAVPWLLMLSTASGATASAQSGLVTPPLNTALSEPSPGARGAPTSLADTARRQARLLAVTKAAGKQASRATSQASREGDAAAFALGATAGTMLGFGIAGHFCHCESSKGVVIGMAVGGVGGLLLFRALKK